MKAELNRPAAQISQIVYQFSSASANNGSAFDGLGVTYGCCFRTNQAPEARPWDIQCQTGGMIFGRYLQIIAADSDSGGARVAKTKLRSDSGTHLRDGNFTFRMSLCSGR